MNLLDVIQNKPEFLILGFELDAGEPVNPKLELLNGPGIDTTTINFEMTDDDFSDGGMQSVLPGYRAVHYSIIVPSIKKYGLGVGTSLTEAVSLCNKIGVEPNFGSDDHRVVDSHDDSGESVAILLVNMSVSEDYLKSVVEHLNEFCLNTNAA